MSCFAPCTTAQLDCTATSASPQHTYTTTSCSSCGHHTWSWRSCEANVSLAYWAGEHSKGWELVNGTMSNGSKLAQRYRLAAAEKCGSTYALRHALWRTCTASIYSLTREPSDHSVGRRNISITVRLSYYLESHTQATSKKL